MKMNMRSETLAKIANARHNYILEIIDKTILRGYGDYFKVSVFTSANGREYKSYRFGTQGLLAILMHTDYNKLDVVKRTILRGM